MLACDNTFWLLQFLEKLIQDVPDCDNIFHNFYKELW